jgi:hypothetical protein
MQVDKIVEALGKLQLQVQEMSDYVKVSKKTFIRTEARKRKFICSISVEREANSHLMQSAQQ